MEMKQNGIPKSEYKIASFGVTSGSPSGFRNTFTRLEELVLGKGATREETRKQVEYATADRSILSREMKSNSGIKVITKELQIYNGKFLVVPENQLTDALHGFKKLGLFGSGGAGKKEYSIYSIYVKPEFKEKVVNELKIQGIEDEQINFLKDNPFPEDGGSTAMYYSVGVTVPEKETKVDTKSEPKESGSSKESKTK